MKKVLALLAGLAAIVAFTVVNQSAGADEAGPNDVAGSGEITSDAGNTVIVPLSFNSADDIFIYDVTVTGTHPDTRLKVSTQDCCIAGDEWGIQLIQSGFGPHEGTPPSGCGKGSTTSYQGGRNTPIGATTKTVRVIVSYCRGVDSFGAGMNVRFIGTNDAPTVSPVLVQHYTPAAA